MNWNIKLKTKNYKDVLLNFSMKHQNTKTMKKPKSLRLKIWLEVENQCNPKSIPSSICKNLQVCSIVRHLQHWCGTQQDIPLLVPRSH
jgi:hypothetical protein